MPITRPWPSSSGPPELPGLIDASVWITLRIGKPFGASIWRWSAETIPVVTVRENPNGLPIAIDESPTFTLLESPSGRGTSSASSGSTLSTARSLEGSRPFTSAFTKSSSSPNRTSTSLAPSTTWALVTIVPSLSTTNPDPVARSAVLFGKAERGLLAGADATSADEDHAATLVLVDVRDAAGPAVAGVVGRLGRHARLGHDLARGVAGVDHVGGDQHGAQHENDEAAEQAGEEVGARRGVRVHGQGSRRRA